MENKTFLIYLCLLVMIVFYVYLGKFAVIISKNLRQAQIDILETLQINFETNFPTL